MIPEAELKGVLMVIMTVLSIIVSNGIDILEAFDVPLIPGFRVI